MTKKYAPATKGNESANRQAHYSTVKQRRETSDERPLYWPLRWRGTKKEAGFCFVDGLINSLLMLSGALFGLLIGVTL